MQPNLQKLINRLSLRQLQVFQAVYQEKGYVRAAAALNLTQPAVSAQMRQLEQAVDAKLFEYVGRQLYVTSAGEKVAEAVALIFGQLATMQGEIRELGGHVSGELRFAVVNTAQYILPYLLQPFLHQFPDISVSVSVVNRAQVLQRLDENRDDLVVMGIVPAERPLASLPFLDNELIPVLRSDHPLMRTTGVTPQQFLDQTLLTREQGSGSRLALEQHCQLLHLHMQPSMALGSNDAVKHAVLAGLGVAVLPRLSVMAELKLGTLATLELEDFPIRRSWCLVYPSAKNPSPVARRFIDYVQGNLARIAQDFSALASV